ncbi:MAG: S1C family serine protease [Bacillota bacterium]|jgi:serine protease Do
MSYFQEKRKSGTFVLFIIILMVVAAILGGILSIYLATNFGLLSGADVNTQEGTNNDQQYAYPTSWNTEVSLVSTVSNKVSPAVVCISNIATANDFYLGTLEMEQGTGSGVVISKDGYIVTNNHVVSGAHKITVSLADGRVLDAKLVATDVLSDLAVIKVEADNLSVVDFGDSDKVMVGELAIAIGNPGGESFARSVTAGVVSGLNRIIMTNEGQQSRLIQTDAAINPGNSGGALVNSQGELIGINTIKISSTEYEGMGFAIPSNTVKEITDDLIKYKKVIRPALGVTIIGDITKQIAAYNDLPIDYGVVVSPISRGPAQTAGMEAYDIIIAIDDKKIEDGYQLQEAIFSKKIGDEVKVTVLRKGKEENIIVKLGEL